MTKRPDIETAEQAFERNKLEAIRRLGRLIALDGFFAKQKKDWGHVGSMAHAVEHLGFALQALCDEEFREFEGDK